MIGLFPACRIRFRKDAWSVSCLFKYRLNYLEEQEIESKRSNREENIC